MYAPDSWYEPDVEPETPADYGWVHQDDLPDVDHCEDMLKGIIEALYTTGDVAALEDCLDELTGQFDMKLPESEPILEKKNKNRLMHWYLGYQRSHIDHMNNTERNYV